MTIDPRFLGFPEWATRTGDLLLPLGYVQQKPDESTWRQFGAGLVSVPAVAAVTPPQPQGYQKWQDWAFKLNESLSLLGL